MAAKPKTLGELRSSGYKVQTVKQEMRRNLIEKMRKGEDIFPGILGFEETVIPQLQNAILSGQDIIFLGERGQAKSRIIRSPGQPARRRDPRRRRQRGQRRPLQPDLAATPRT